MSADAPAIPRIITSRQTDRRFYTTMAVAIAAAVFVGFMPTFYLRARYIPDPLPLYLKIHGTVFSTWILFFLLQNVLVAARKTSIHRKIGWVGAGLAVLMVMVGTMAGILSGRRNVEAGQAFAAQVFLTTPLFSMLMFSTLIGAAVALRKQTEVHKRLMLLATISLLDAAVARWPFEIMVTTSWAFYVVTDLFIVAAILYDFTTRRVVHPVYMWGGLLIVAEQALRTPIGNTALWHSIAQSIIGPGI